MLALPELSAEELERYAWQLGVSGLGPTGQRRLKASTVFVSRVGGVGGTVAMLLAAAGVGRLILAHAGNIRLNDLNRQLLMSSEALNQPRIESAAAQLHRLNPHVALETIGENVSAENVERLAGQADLIVSAAPLFAERLAMNRLAVERRVPLVDASMYDMEARLVSVLPGETACLSCLYPEPPPHWRRQFPVLGAVASTIASLAAVEAIKLLSGIEGPPGQANSPGPGLLHFDLLRMSLTRVAVARRNECATCGSLPASAPAPAS